MRVIAGTARRMQLKTPTGMDTRPTQDIIKETLFNIIQFEIPGCIFLDLCAGSGAIGIEALSRGAKHAYFAENGREAASCIQENLIYLDPPYESDTVSRVLAELLHVNYVDENTRIIIETSLTSDMDFLEDLGYVVEREKTYHSQRHLFVRKKAAQEA